MQEEMSASLHEKRTLKKTVIERSSVESDLIVLHSIVTEYEEKIQDVLQRMHMKDEKSEERLRIAEENTCVFVNIPDFMSAMTSPLKLKVNCIRPSGAHSFVGHLKFGVRALSEEEHCERISAWRASQGHPHIHRLLGIFEDKLPSFSMGNGAMGMSEIHALAICEETDLSLFDLLHRDDHNASLSFDDGLSILIDIGSALLHLHSHHGVVHGCLTSHCVLLKCSELESRYHCYVSEVGLWNEDAMNDDRIRWMAPELVSSSGPFQPTFSSDMWSFGMLMEEILTRTVPFEMFDRVAPIGIAIASGQFEEQPYIILPGCVSDDQMSKLHDISKACRMMNPHDRQVIEVVVSHLRKIVAKDI
eukprot:TRINITY_DN829_c0_g1_i1.p1 TRINITY_DN829_c0_g1~~TRINITY_DN829_c0_g1_i1.p1  ORF type:complete len:361 (-),score=107.42 TRINITY_DN829_c0_g1_i1:29-1111(-)